MQINKREISILIPVLVLWCILLAAGWYFSHYWEWSMRWGTHWFEIDWVVRAVLALSSVALLLVWRRSRHISLSTWLLFGIPLIVSELLRLKVGVAVRDFSRVDNPAQLVTYSMYSTAYIASVLFWIIAFPYEHMWDRSSTYRPVSWRVGLSGASLVIVGLSAYHSFALLGSGSSSISAMEALQRQTELATLIVFVILIVRTLAPATASLIVATFKSKGPTAGGSNSTL